MLCWLTCCLLEKPLNTLLLTRPDDWHVHLRDGPALSHTVPATAAHFSRALVMPNLSPPLTTLASLDAYRERILQQTLPQHAFTPYMTFYLNAAVKPEDLIAASQHPYVLGAKYYPAGATTHSQQGAKSIAELYPLLELMQQLGLVLQIHGETTAGDIFHREAQFIHEVLSQVVTQFPKLRIVLEHISSKEAVAFVQAAPDHVAATITPQHLLYNRNDMLAGGIRPHYYCLPILKSQRDQHALHTAVVSGNPKFFAGTDSAPHAKSDKEAACGCAGVYSAPYAVALYAQLFDTLDALPRLNGFLGEHGAQFYQLPATTQQLELVRKPQTIAGSLPFGENIVVPIAANQTLAWSVLT